MRFAAVLLFAAASLASAVTILQRHNTLPQCASDCAAKSSFAPCKSTDIPCICLNYKYGAKVEKCVKECCSEKDARIAAADADAYCKAAGVDVENPWPDCALPCIKNTPEGNCKSGDDRCLCKDSTFILSIGHCFHKSCTGKDLTTAEMVGAALCRANGVDIKPIIEGGH